MIINKDNIASLDWEKTNHLIPCIVQDIHTGVIQMLGYMDQEAVNVTLDSGNVTFFSRSKQRLWMKGESSGNVLQLHQLSVDCDNDTLIALVTPHGPTCHLGTNSCWNNDSDPTLAFLGALDKLLAARKTADPDSSYTAKLYAKGIKRIAQKVGEEGVETALAATVGDREELKNEAADLLYHLLVLLQASDVKLGDVIGQLKDRHQ